MGAQEVLHGTAEDPKALQFLPPEVSLQLCGLHQEAEPTTHGCRNLAQVASIGEMIMPSQTMGTGLCCPHAANTGNHRIPVDQGGAPAQATPPSTTPPCPVLCALPSNLPSQNPPRPASWPRTIGRKAQGGPRALEFLSSSKATYTDLHCLQQRCKNQDTK